MFPVIRPEALGLEPWIAQKIIEALDTYTAKGILTILRVNRGALYLHYLCVQYHYPVILKPIFIKGTEANPIKSRKKSAIAPFMTADESINWFGFHVELMDLHYPMGHLKHLYRKPEKISRGKEIGKPDIELISAKAGILTICDIGEPQKTYRIKIDGLDLDNPNDFFDSPFYQEDAEIAILDEQDQPVKVLGMHDQRIPKLIVADIDAHAFGEYLDRWDAIDETAYNTSRKDGQIQLKIAVRHELEREDKVPKHLWPAILNIPPTRGNITAREYLALFCINQVCERFQALDYVVQHGSTSRFPIKISERTSGRKGFPKVDPEMVYGALFPNGKIVGFTGLKILAFYLIMNQRGYNFRMHEDWDEQLRTELSPQALQEMVEDLEEDLIKYKILEERAPIEYATIAQSAFHPRSAKEQQKLLSEYQERHEQFETSQAESQQGRYFHSP